MNRILIISDDEELMRNLKNILDTQFQVWAYSADLPDDAVPDLILVVAQAHFSQFLIAKAKIDDTYAGIPILFLWVEEEYIHFLTCNDLKQARERTISRSSNELLEYLSEYIPKSSGQQLAEIQSDIRSNYLKNNMGGALAVEYDSFASIYQFVEQLADRSGQCVQTLLLTLKLRENAEPSQNALQSAMAQLSEAVQMTLRKNDVLTDCGDAQMLVLLMDADDDGGHLAANRIFNTFLGLYDGDSYDLFYDIKPLGVKT